MLPGAHIISKQKISVSYRGKADALALQQQINAICQHKLPAKLSSIMDRFADENRLIRLDKIHVNAEILDSSNFEEQLIDIIGEELERSLLSAIRDTPEAVVETHQNDNFVQLLVFYLAHGYLPWWSQVQDVASWKEQLSDFLENNQTAVPDELRQALQNERCASRLAALITLDQTVVMATLLHPKNASIIALMNVELRRLYSHVGLAEHLSDLQGEIYFAWKKAILQQRQIAGNDILVAFARSFIMLLEKKGKSQLMAQITNAIQLAVFKQSLIAVAKTKSEISLPEPSVVTKRSNDGEHRILILNAGLVIVAPYLTTFFKHLELIKDNQIVDPSRAVALVHFIATGKESFEEFEVALEKLLCGLELSDLVLGTYQISEDEKQQIDELLTSVISHWVILKNTSIAGLRASFIQREGRLNIGDNQVQLLVQQQAHDMLLDHVPWNFKMIKLPWMKRLLTVEWG